MLAVGRHFASHLDPVERSLFLRWAECRSGRLPPRIYELDPSRFADLAPNLQIHRLEPDGRLLCLLSGCGIVQIVGFDTTNRYADEVFADVYRSRHFYFARALETGRPVMYRARVPISGQPSRISRRLLLPLRTGDGQCDNVLSLLRFDHPSGFALRLDPPQLAILEWHEMTASEDQEAAAVIHT